MPNTILHKRNTTPGATPASGSLSAGELAINTADGVLFTKNESGVVLRSTPLDPSGRLVIGPHGTAGGTAGEIRLRELSANGSDYVGLKAPDSIPSSLTWTLPNVDGASGQVMSTNGAGAFIWSNAGGGGLTGTGTTGYIPRFTGSTAVSNSNVFDNGTDAAVGNTSPSGRLHVTSNTPSKRILYLEGSVGQTANYLEGTNASGNSVFVIAPTGRITGPADNDFIIRGGTPATSANGRNLILMGGSGNGSTIQGSITFDGTNHTFQNGNVTLYNISASYNHGFGFNNSSNFGVSGDFHAFNFGRIGYGGATASGLTQTTLQNSTTGEHILARFGEKRVSFTTASGSVTPINRNFVIAQPSYTSATAGIRTITNAINVDIEGVPTQSGLVALTNQIALRVQAGAPSGIPLRLVGASGQVRNTFEVSDFNGNITSAIDPSGRVIVGPHGTAAGTAGEIRLQELAANGNTYVGFKAADLINTSITWTLPATDGTSGQVISTNGTGTLSWASVAPLTPRVSSTTSTATITPDFGSFDMYALTAQAVGLTLANPTITPSNGQKMIVRIRDNGTGQTIAYGTKYRAIGVNLPTTTFANKTLYFGIIYNALTDNLDVVAVSQEA